LALALTGGCGGGKGSGDETSDPTAAADDDDTGLPMDDDGADTGDDGTPGTGGDGADADAGSGDDGPADTGADGGEGGADSAGFIDMPDGGGVDIQCDLWAQDCPAGEKCMPWANDGGGSWNATRCSPLDANPAQSGDSCTVEGSGVSGIDNCDISAMCWDVGEEGTGVCVPFCSGSAEAPICDNPDEGCSITNDGVLILCLPFCDPLIQDCPEGNACYPEPNGFFCSPDASGESGVFGDPCEYINVCDPGFWCADATAVPGCAGAIGCCSSYCDVSDPTSTCEGDGQECVAWWEDPPPGEEHFGVCVIPQ
jgi:hypothetical protein